MTRNRRRRCFAKEGCYSTRRKEMKKGGNAKRAGVLIADLDYACTLLPLYKNAYVQSTIQPISELRRGLSGSRGNL